MLEEALALHRAGQLVGARRLYRKILEAEPGHPEALRLLGMLEAQRGNAGEARSLLGRSNGVHPESAAAYAALGDVQKTMRRFDAALASYDHALAIEPGFALAHFNRALTLHTLGRLAEALSSCDAAVSLDPALPEAWNHRGCVLGALDRASEAVASFDRALALRPAFPEAQANRAVALQASGGRAVGAAVAAEVLSILDEVLAANPGLVEARNNRGTVLREMGRSAEALAEYDRALAQKPDFAVAHGNRGKVLAELQRYDESIASFDRALALDSRSTDALLNRGAALAAVKRHDDAARDFARALEIDPALPAAPGLLFHARANVCDWEGYDAAAQRLVADARDERPTSTPLVMLSVTDSARDQRACARTWVKETSPALPSPLWCGERYGHMRIRLAYLSSDLDEHAVAYLMAGVFEQHDRSRFETFALSSGPDPEGGMRARLKGAFEHFIDVRDRGDRDLAALIREREIDIVVDLNGHTQGSRTRSLAWRPSPVAVTYLGFPGTLGAEYVDFLLADRFVIPEGLEAAYAEQVVCLPDTFQANDRSRASGRTGSRAEAGLPENAIVFCAFNNAYKITPPTFDVWMRLLEQADGSVLWLVGGRDALHANLAREAGRRGVDPARLVFAPRLPYADHLARFRLADLFLDTLPFNGGTTASDALWAGLPVLTCAGEAMASRMAGSLLHAVGMPELVTRSLADYEALALTLARDPARIASLKATLARHRETHPLFDTGRFCRHLEAAYEAMLDAKLSRSSGA
jgi:predicted O-linked N-acetylglucosamine transferase (SPINDLY family)